MRKKDKDATDAQDFTGMPAASAVGDGRRYPVQGVQRLAVRWLPDARRRRVPGPDHRVDDEARRREPAVALGERAARSHRRSARRTWRTRRARPTRSSRAHGRRPPRSCRTRGRRPRSGRPPPWWPGPTPVEPPWRRSSSQERDFLQQLATLVQSHAESVKGMAKASRAKPAAAAAAGAPRRLRRPRAGADRPRRPHAGARVRLDAADAAGEARRGPAGQLNERSSGRRRRSAWRSRRRRPSAPATRTMTRDRARAATGRCGSCSGARSEPGRPPCGGRPPVRRIVRPDPRRRGRVGRRAAGRRRPEAADRGARRERRRPAPVVARRRQALGLEAFRRLMPTD